MISRRGEPGPGLYRFAGMNAVVRMRRPGFTTGSTGYAVRVATVEQRLERAILDLADARGPAKSICPSEATRAVGGEEWRDLMDQARAVARKLAARGRVVLTSRGRELSPSEEWRGPIRIRTTAG